MARDTREAAVDALNDSELDQLLAAIGTEPTGKRNRAAVLLMADSGLRVGEVIALELRDVVRKAGQISEVILRQTKGGRPARQPVTARTAVALAEWLEARARLVGDASPVLICSISRGQAGGLGSGGELAPGRALSRAYLGQALDRAGKAAGLRMRVHPHLLRHTAATRYLRATGDLERTRAFLRHADITTTARVYAHLVAEDVAEGQRAMERRAAGDVAEAAGGDVAGLVAALGELTAEQRRALAAALLGGADGPETLPVGGLRR